MRLLVLAVLLAPAFAHADPKKPQLTADEKKCKVLVDDGRTLAAKSKLKEAIGKFEACIALVGDDPTALGELGYTAYLVKDLVKAEQATRKALASQSTPNLRGAVAYNLGLILDAKKDRTGAIAAYADSLRARPNATVRGKLRALDPKAAEAFDPYQPVPLAGPFPSIAGFCKTLPADDPELFRGVKAPCVCGDKLATGTAKPPYTKLQIFRRTCATDGRRDESFGEDEVRLAVEIAGGWYIGSITKQYFSRRCHDENSFPVFTTRDLVPGGQAEVAIEHTDDGECRKEGFWKRRGLVVVGIGASAKPSATPLIPLVDYQENWDQEASDFKPSTDVQLKAKWNADGSLEIGGSTKGLDKETAGDLLGRHVLPFP